jgi:hypothetical protein
MVSFLRYFGMGSLENLAHNILKNLQITVTLNYLGK